jgi:hypothetical protein
MDNFTPLRNGILEHLRDGKLCPFDFGIYALLHLGADWSTGIYHGCAGTIAYQFGAPTLKPHINKTLMRLRERKYINYRKGNGTRGGYPILIHKYEVRISELSGQRLNAWKNGELALPEYEPWNCGGTLAALRPAVKTTRKQDSTPAPENFTPNEHNRKLATELGLDLAVIVPAFLAHHASKENTFKDWQKALETWLHRERGFCKPNGTNGKPHQPMVDLMDVSRKAGIVT